MDDGFTLDFLKEISPALQRGSMIRLSCRKQLDELLLSKYPFDIGRIQWGSLPDSSYMEQKCDGLDSKSLSDFLASIAQQTCTSDDDIIMFSGDLIEVDLQMAFSVLVGWRKVLLSYPQHVYVFPKDASWCFNYTFEEDMYFGFAPAARDLRRARHAR